MDDVAQKVISILKSNMAEPDVELTETSNLADLGIESLDFAVIIFDMEDTFGIEIPFDASENADDFKTIGDIVNIVKKLQAEKNSASA